MSSPRLRRTIAGLLTVLPALAFACLLGWHYRATDPQRDGQIFVHSARNAWTLPLKAENFWPEWLHKGSYVSMGLLGLTHLFGADQILALRVLQFALFTTAIIAFAVIVRSAFADISTLEATLLTFIFSITPAYLGYFVGVAIDFIALPFMLAYLAALCTRRFGLAALLGTAYAFSTETGCLAYRVTLPIVLLYSLERFGPINRWPKLTRSAFFLPYYFKAMHLLAHGSGEVGYQLGFCSKHTMLDFVLSPNLTFREVQDYLFDLFALNFQWLLLLVAIPGLVVLARRAIADRDALAANLERVRWPVIVVLLSFLVTQLYVITRCPVWNNVKYVIQAMPLTLIAAYWLSLYVLRARVARVAFFAGVAALFAASTVRTVDPVSVAYFGLAPYIEQPTLCMNSRTRVPEETQCGNDEMIYNLQFFVPF